MHVLILRRELLYFLRDSECLAKLCLGGTKHSYFRIMLFSWSTFTAMSSWAKDISSVIILNKEPLRKLQGGGDSTEWNGKERNWGLIHAAE